MSYFNDPTIWWVRVNIVSIWGTNPVDKKIKNKY